MSQLERFNMYKRCLIWIFVAVLFAGPFWQNQSTTKDLPDAFNPLLPNVTVIDAGGTIFGRGPSPTDNRGYISGEIDAKEAFSDVFVLLAGKANIRYIKYGSFDGKDLNSTHHIEIAQLVQREVDRADVTAVLFIGGTDGAEVGYTLAWTINTDRAIITLGAGQPATSIGSEASRVLVSSVLLAIDPDAKGRGVMLVSGDYIHQARIAYKFNPNKFDAFRTQAGEPLGTFENLRPFFYLPPVRPNYPTFNVSHLRPEDGLPQVDILYIYPEFNTALLRASIDSVTEGIVFISLGDGYSPGKEGDKMKAMLDGTSIPVVLCAEHGSGHIRQSHASFGIGGGPIPARSMRVLLRLVLKLATKLALGPGDVEDFLASFLTKNF